MINRLIYPILLLTIFFLSCNKLSSSENIDSSTNNGEKGPRRLNIFFSSEGKTSPSIDGYIILGWLSKVILKYDEDGEEREDIIDFDSYFSHIDIPLSSVCTKIPTMTFNTWGPSNLIILNNLNSPLIRMAFNEIGLDLTDYQPVNREINQQAMALTPSIETNGQIFLKSVDLKFDYLDYIEEVFDFSYLLEMRLSSNPLDTKKVEKTRHTRFEVIELLWEPATPLEVPPHTETDVFLHIDPLWDCDMPLYELQLQEEIAMRYIKKIEDGICRVPPAFNEAKPIPSMIPLDGWVSVVFKPSVDKVKILEYLGGYYTIMPLGNLGDGDGWEVYIKVGSPGTECFVFEYIEEKLSRAEFIVGSSHKIGFQEINLLPKTMLCGNSFPYQ